MGCKFPSAQTAYHDNSEPNEDSYDLNYDIKRGNLVIFVEPNCSRCSKCVEVLQSVNIRPVIIDVSTISNSRALKKALKENSGSSSFPYVYVVKKYYGTLADVEKGVSNHTIQKLINSNLERIGGRLHS